jgi:NET1-associated nuclear protein 1 (U3 small nucleolar RNA-associated protein 17)
VRQTNGGTFALQCVAFDGCDQVLAAGDASGRIMLWHNFADHLVAAQQQQQAARKEQQQAQPEALLPPPRATWHWHAHAVRCLVFSSDSTYLMSGGQEAVMVGGSYCTGSCAGHDDGHVGVMWCGPPSCSVSCI